MFRKGVRVQGSNKLKGSDKKKLRDAVQRAFPLLKEDEAALDLLVPSKGDLSVTKISGSHMLVYSLDGEPMLIDQSGKNDFYPTVMALWKVPHLLPTLTIHPPVFKYVSGGADVMLPGVVVPRGGLQEMGNFLKGNKRQVVLDGSKAAVAVGEMELGSVAMQQSGMKGKALRCVHVFGDQLWEMGSKGQLPHMPCPLLEAEQQDQPDETPQVEKPADAAESVNTGKEEEDFEHETKYVKDEEHPTSEEGLPGGEGEDEWEPTALVDYCFLKAIKYHLKDSLLPVLVSAFYSTYMLPARPSGTTLDIKKSKYKKMSVLLAQMEDSGLIKSKEVSPGVAHIYEVNRTHDMYRSFVKKEETVTPEAQPGSSSTGFSITPVFRLPSGLSTPFAPDRSPKELFFAPQARQLLTDYITAKKLTSTKDPRMISLDKLLVGNLFKDCQEGALVSKQQVTEKYMNCLQECVRIERDGIAEIKKGALKPITLTLERRQGMKHVTLIQGLENFRLSPDELAKELKVICACSTSVHQLPAKGAGKEVMVQGKLVKEIVGLLTTKHQIPKRYIETIEKGKKS